MDAKIILNGEATLEELYKLYELGYEFVIEDGVVKSIIRK